MILRPLRHRVNVILVFVALTACLAMSLLVGILEYHEIETEYLQTMRSRMSVARALIKNTLFQTDIMVQSIMEAEPDKVETVLLELSASSYFQNTGDSIYVLDNRGRVEFIAEQYASYRGLDFSAMVTREHASKRMVRHHYQSLLSNNAVIIIQYTLGDGYLVVERNLDNFIPVMAVFEEGRLFDGELFFVLSATGQTLYHSDYSLVRTRHNLAFDLKDMEQPDKRGMFTFTYKNRKYFALNEKFQEPSNWIIYYCVPRTVINYTIWKNLAYPLGQLLVFFLLLFLSIRILFDRLFSNPVNNIVSALSLSAQHNGLALTPEMSRGISEFDAIIKAITSRDHEVAETVGRFQTVLNSLDALVYVSDLETYELLFLNKYGRKIWGDCTGRKCYEVLQKDRSEPCEFCTNHLLIDESGEPKGVHLWEFKNTVTGQWFECRDRAISWSGGKLVRMEIATDVSARKNVELALQAEKERLNVTLRSIGDGVITTDINGHVLFLNKVAEDLCGWRNEEAMGLPSTRVFNIINEKTGEKCVSPVQRVIELGRIIGLANHTALIARDGSIRSIADSGSPIRDKDSHIIGVVLVFRDVTHEKMMEEELLKIRKLESVGVLAGGIAHDFNNILSAILGNIELVGYRIGKEDERTATLLKDAEKATKRAAKLTDQLLTFSKGGEPVREIVSLPDLVSEAAGFVLRGSKVLCNYNYPEDLWEVDVDAGQIAQVIQNIIINAKQAMPEGGTITINCGNVTDAATESLLSVDDGTYVRLSIHDTGIGIPREIINKIFDPYFSTKSEGSGLGLAICHSIIDKHNGYLTVQSIPGKGSTFTIYLPSVVSLEMRNADSGRMTVKGAVKSARIMVMDDERMLRELTASQLDMLGHEAVLVEDGEQAINKYQEMQDNGTPVDLIIMDLTIPGGMGGQVAAEKMLKLDPGVKIIVASGYSNDPVMAEYQRYGFRAALVKPFDLKQLADVLTGILAES